jgi:transcriptional regulator with XRE-family HTH domain
VPGGGQDHEKTRDQLRSQMLADGKTYEQIATAMVEKFQDRRRVAWRNAHGWTQDHVADLFNGFVGDPRCPMKGTRISDFERWPNGGSKPTPETLAILAENYGTHLLNLVDERDRQNMSLKEQAVLTALEKQFASESGDARRSKLSVAYAASMGPQQLPNTPPYFVGRTEELDKLTAQLDSAAEGHPVVITAISGTAGIGKTALAVKWAQTHIDRFPDGQLYVNLRGFHPTGTPMTAQEAIRGFLDAFNTPVEKIPVSPDAQAALYRNIVKDKKLVIVLDNARDTDQVRPLLPDNPTCMVLVTSRQLLETLIYEDVAHIILGFLNTEEARRLLTEILKLERIEAEPGTVDELIHRCVHLPTALHIAAARIKAEPYTSLSVLLGQLREQPQCLAALSTGDSIHFDIRAVFSWSYTALSTGAARLFRLLGLHPGPNISTLAAASLAGLPEHDTRNLLAELTRAYLLEESTPERYQFHDLLRAYANEKACIEESEPQQQSARHRVLDHYLHTAHAAARILDPTPPRRLR